MKFLFLSLFFFACFRASVADGNDTHGPSGESPTITLTPITEPTTGSTGHPTTNGSQTTELPFSSTTNMSTAPLNTTTQPTEPPSTSAPTNPSTTVQTTDFPSTSKDGELVAFAKHNFNVASFVGGMVLIVALQGIAFFAYKFIKSRSSNYQHLGDTDTII
uniref:sialomucin core protein 24-like isoform X1 n=2 Tax=Myxine glutinosa TaxID=7769 RepID=UPI00358E549C